MLNIAAGNPITGYNLTRSLRLRNSVSAYLNRTFGASGNRNIWTWSGWRKRGRLGDDFNLFGAYPSAAARAFIKFTATDNLRFGSTGTGGNLITTQVFRDPAAWYHFIVAYDDTQATASNRLKFYVNGVQITSFSTATYPDQNFGGYINSANPHYIGQAGDNTEFFDGYLAEDQFVNGLQLTPSSFGSTNSVTGVWQPAPYTGTYGTNGFYLPFTDNSALTTSSNVGLGKDFSGNGNYWVTNNISITAGVTYDSMTDVPTLTSATASNFAVLNPLKNATILSNANLTFSGQASSVNYSTGTIAVTSGKYYFEVVASVFAPGSAVIGFGVAKTTVNIASPSTSDVYIYNNNGTKYGGGAGAVAYGASYAVSDIVGVALDMDSGTLTFYKNNVSQGTAFTGLTGQTITASLYTYGDVSIFSAGSINFGQRPFAYTPPTGYVSLNTFNLPNSTIVKGNTVMDATTYSGNGTTLSVVNTAGFKPDLVWYKARSFAYDNSLFDSVRGASNQLVSNLTQAETSLSGVTAFNSNGFTLGSSVNGNNGTSTYVAWQWQAGQGSTSSNTNGTITSSVSVNASAGFSVVTYTGTGVNATVGHGLGVAPQFIIVKNRDAADAWQVYHAANTANPETDYLVLNTTAATADAADRWNDTAPTSSVFSIGNGVEVNTNTEKYVAYCWTPIAGYSAFGSFVGNNSGDGPFVYLGFRPKYILIKSSSNTVDWIVEDSARNTYNVSNSKLSPNSSGAEFTDTNAVGIDFLSNGFKIRGVDASVNASGYTYIYACWAENPFRNSLAR